MKDVIKRYSNGEVIVIWQPALCIHSAVCVGGLPQVFHPQTKPWITLQHADTAAIINQVEQCPSGALSYEKVNKDE
jgi:uncharacterized Fe-S cluster protein YjdI